MAEATHSGAEITLDVSTLAPPEPLRRVLGALEELQRGQYVRMLHRMEPIPLYGILDADGFAHLTLLGEETSFEIYIWRRGDTDAEQALRVGRRPEGLA